MGHCLCVIAASHPVADAIVAEHPRLQRLKTTKRFAIIPVDADFVDASIPNVPTRVRVSGDDFILLTVGFQEFLQSISRFGTLAYLETDYFGGNGGQGAAVYSKGESLMLPKWSKSGVINHALKLIGVPKPLLGDRFSAIQSHRYRNNEEVIPTPRIVRAPCA